MMPQVHMKIYASHDAILYMNDGSVAYLRMKYPPRYNMPNPSPAQAISSKMISTSGIVQAYSESNFTGTIYVNLNLMVRFEVIPNPVEEEPEEPVTESTT